MSDTDIESESLATDRKDTGVLRTPPQIIGGLLGLGIVLGCYVALSLNGKNTGEFLGFIVGIAALIPGTAIYNKARQLERDNVEIKKQTNGPLTRTHETIKDVDVRLNTLESGFTEMQDTLQQISDKLTTKGY